MAVLPAGDRPSWTAARLVRPAADLARSVRFYRASGRATYRSTRRLRLVVAAARSGVTG